MNVLTRVELDGVITTVSRRLVYYPACDLCAGKMTILQDESQQVTRYWCRRCNEKRAEGDIRYRYCLVLLVSDQTSAAHVTAFGNGWDKLFGVTATKLNNILKEFSLRTCYEAVFQCFYDSVVATLLGQRLKFKFNVHLTKAIPRGQISLNTVLSNRATTGEHNLIATSFSLMDVKDFRSVMSVLEAKLFQMTTNTLKLNSGVSGNNGQLTHNNSYLFGSWLSESVSQRMCLVSLDQASQDHKLTSQDNLVDSVYWKWEATQDTSTFDEDIIQDIVSYLEESKNDFWTTERDSILSENCDFDAIREETYSDSFMEHFCMPTQLQHTLHYTGTPSTVKTSPYLSDGYSPDLFASGIKSSSKKDVTLKDISTPSKLVTPSRILFNDSLNSPNLFTRTPTSLTGTNDFTSPAIC